MPPLTTSRLPKSKARPSGKLPKPSASPPRGSIACSSGVESGYRDGTAFGPQAKASRQRAQRVQATEQKKPATTSEQAQAAAARARAETAKAEAAKAKADAQKAKAEADKAKADARTARAKEKARSYSFFRMLSAAPQRRRDSQRPLNSWSKLSECSARIRTVSARTLRLSLRSNAPSLA